MKRKISFFCWGLQVLLGTAAVVSFILLACSGENILKWIPALLLSLVLIYSGVQQIIILKKGNNENE